MKKKRLLSVFLVLVMTHSLMSTNVFAGNQKDAYAEGTHSNHCICGVRDCNNSEHGESLTWKGINSLSEITKDGNYYLKQDVTLDETWTCNYNVNICLNGKTITGKNGKDVISVTSRMNFAITDCQKNVGKITHNNGETGRGIFNHGIFTLWNGSISGNILEDVVVGAGVYNFSGTFNMNGGSITGNITENKGGAVYNYYSGTFNMNGGKIAGNTAQNGGSVYNNGEFILMGGSISDNRSSYDGGGVYNNSHATFIMDNGSISDNRAEDGGGGVYNSGKFIMNDGCISDNSVPENYKHGGGVLNASEFIMKNGIISGNRACYGGGVYNNGKGDAVFTMNGGVIGGYEDNGNTSVYSGGGVCNIATFYMSGNAAIIGNKTQEYGGGVQNDGKLFRLSGNVKITENTVIGDISNVYVWPGNTLVTTGMGMDAIVGITGHYADQIVVTGTTSTAGFVSDSENYELASSDNGLVWLRKENVKVEGTGTVTLDGWTYGDAANKPVPDSTTNGTNNVRYQYREKNAADTEPWQDAVPTDVGEYTIKAIFAATSNYKEVITTADFTIAKKKLTIENLKVADKTYDGLATADISGTPILTGVVNGDDVTLVNGIPSFTSVNAGRDIAINFTDFSLTGIDADNYELIQPTGITASIVEDTTAPVIDGAEDGKTYCGAVVLTITDNNLDTVTLDGKVVTLTDGKLTLEPKEGKQTVIAADKAGNKTTLIVTVNNGHTGDRAVATENEPVKCIYCGYVIAPALGHSCANHLNYVEAKVATTATEGNIAYWYCAVCDKYFSDENANNEIKKEDTIIAKLTPVIIKGDKATVSADEKKELSFTSDAIYEDFIRVEVDGKTVDESNYTVKSGSTIVTLKADYVASLSEGNHTLSIVSMSGTATAGFTKNKKKIEKIDTEIVDTKTEDTEIVNTEKVETAPKTGDKNYPVFWISMFTCSIMALGLAAVTGRRKRKDI